MTRHPAVFRRTATPSCAATLVALLLCPLEYFRQNPNPSGTPAQAQTQRDAASDAAARRKKFEDDRKRLEAGGETPTEVPSPPDATFFVSPSKVNMLVGNRQPFCAFDINGKTLTGSAEWSLGAGATATLSMMEGPEILATAPGHFTVRAKLGSRYAEADVTVLEGHTLPTGTAKWTAAEIPGYKLKQIVPAVPSANGPDVFANEMSADGTSLIRAFTSEGIQLWMTKVNSPVDQVIPTFGSSPRNKP